ncbi:LytR/AlgR family response regulator transcription factor [Arenicella xantha]|uniref:LytTr DNA-binding domain-containing protein n=1 Tax=Arenicella xantha TaxID=644221 RepID=A0A395JK46_9GAMM|nr:LytTR family DNA-binding domain-containing protein [Arenicella xantha]RBP51146.1 LytTr DNA-binding domain-containing protein [Arenicella xantha]
MIKHLASSLWLILAFGGVPPTTAAQTLGTIDENVIVCPDTGANEVLPDFGSTLCHVADFYSIAPADHSLWIRRIVTLDQAQLSQPLPIGLFISGKVASYSYVNDHLVGQNGEPGTNKASEIPGSMDAVWYVPKNFLRVGENHLDLRISSHHGYFELAYPLHYLGLAPYASPTDTLLNHYWKTLLPLGVLILGLLYSGVLAVKQETKMPHFLLPAMALFTSIQLCAEVIRGLVAYPYPAHDIRLMIILICSLCFGLSLLAHVLITLRAPYPKASFGVAASATILVLIVAPGFDHKSALALGVPCVFSLAVAVYNVSRNTPGAWAIAAGVGLFLVAILMSPGEFLDTYYFYLVAALILFLFIQHSSVITRAREQRSAEKARADKLQFIVDQNRLDTDSPTLSIKSANKTELISINDIAYCKGAGDYVELVLDSGQRVLHNDKLNDLEETLPSTFTRVHRSYIVNTTKIVSIERKPSGTGAIELSNHDTIPVSRRIMPSVRERLVAV